MKYEINIKAIKFTGGNVVDVIYFIINNSPKGDDPKTTEHFSFWEEKVEICLKKEGIRTQWIKKGDFVVKTNKDLYCEIMTDVNYLYVPINDWLLENGTIKTLSKELKWRHRKTLKSFRQLIGSKQHEN
jgi:hypothetical protein